MSEESLQRIGYALYALDSSLRFVGIIVFIGLVVATLAIAWMKEPRGLCDWKDHAADPPQWLDDNGTLLSVSGAKTGDLCHAMDDAWWPCKPTLKDVKGGDMAEWLDDLRVREYPR